MPLSFSLRLGLVASVLATAPVLVGYRAYAGDSDAGFTAVGGGISPADMASIRHDLDQQTESVTSVASPASSGLVAPAMPKAASSGLTAPKGSVQDKITNRVSSALKVPQPLPNASGDPSQPEMTQLYDEKKRPYYYDRNHEFHPGTVPDNSLTNAIAADPLSRNDSVTFADDAHDSGAISASPSSVPVDDEVYNDQPDGSAGQVGPNGQKKPGQRGPRPPTDSEGRPLLPYYGNDPREDKEAELNEVLEHLLPPDDAIIAMRRKRAAAQRADVAPLQTTTPTIRTLNLTLSPGETPPVIHMSYGNTTSLTFSDIAGNPWYVTRAETDKIAYGAVYQNGDDDTRTNIVSITPKREYSQGRNLTVFLEHMPVPVIFQLDTGIAPKVDYRVDVSIRHRGPMTKTAVIDQGIAHPQDKVMQSFVEGLTPDHAIKLKTSNQNVEAWRIGKSMYIRSPMPLRGPHYTKRAQGNIDGVLVYEVQYTPDITMADGGELIPVRVGK